MEIGTHSSRVLALIRQALDEFEQAPLAGSTRRAARVANLMGHTQQAIRFSLELHGGGDPSANRADIQRLMKNPSTLGDGSSDADLAVRQFLNDRETEPGQSEEDGKIYGGSLEQLVDLLATTNEGLQSPDLSESNRRKLLELRSTCTSLLTIVRQRLFNYLLEAEREYTFLETNSSAFDERRLRVERVLGSAAPGVLDQFNAVFARLEDAAARGLDRPASEELSQAVTSCRRILKAVVDLVQPADPDQPTSTEGHELSEERYKNRLFEFLKNQSDSSSYLAAQQASLASLWERFKATDALASKGVHAAMARNEAEFCALNTYLLAAEILSIRAPLVPQ